MKYLYLLFMLALPTLSAIAQPQYDAYRGTETQVEISRELPNFVLYAYFNRIDSVFMPIAAGASADALPYEQFIAAKFTRALPQGLLHPCAHQSSAAFQTAHQHYLQYAVKWEETGIDLIAARITAIDTLARSTHDYALYLSAPTGTDQVSIRPKDLHPTHPDHWVQIVPLFLFQALFADHTDLPFAHTHCQAPFSSFDLACLLSVLNQLSAPRLGQLLQQYSPQFSHCHRP